MSFSKMSTKIEKLDHYSKERVNKGTNYLTGKCVGCCYVCQMNVFMSFIHYSKERVNKGTNYLTGG